jgi:ferritin-like metal-binding protein YciE
MANDGMKMLFVQGLQALHAADEQGRITAADLEKAASNPKLKEALKEGSQVAQNLDQQLGQVFQQAGEKPGHIKNHAIEGIAEDAQQVRESEKEPRARDLGIIAHAQIALHYHIALYGTLAAYAQALGMKEAAQTLHNMLEEVKAQDQKYTQLATQLLA